ncbi:magnesium/cobalt transporter CorA [Halorhabdus sp. BNX81]|uniref:magnesium/cobalt transporter CorA n=1 Tax=Halorhabdus sp. BNX81 TaxID=2980181 RepID=UPI0023DD1D87|nr:magnesium/cobalt transporter CorA [Halorhabdus sp. BNX81]WEL21452.1 Mg2 and Co2 transporter [Halorhabdus sp. BNX81]
MIDALVYDGTGVESVEDIAAARAADGTTWVHVEDASDAEIDAVADAFDLHALAIEDVRNNVRAKSEEFSAYTFALVKTARLTRGETTFEEEIDDEPVGLFIGDDWLVTVATGSADPVARVQESVRRGDERLLERGPDFTAYRVLDVLVDSYFEILEHLEGQIEAIEDEVVESPDADLLGEINSVRRELLSFRKVVWPVRETLAVLARGDVTTIHADTQKYYRDVYDHLVQLVDLLETYRDLVVGTRDIYLNALSQSTNEVMKVLTVVATIFIPLTFVAGVYGMNFSGGPYNMPELTWEFGYPAVMLGMAGVAALMVFYFRRQSYL